jgi:hypothetical protein
VHDSTLLFCLRPCMEPRRLASRHTAALMVAWRTAEEALSSAYYRLVYRGTSTAPFKRAPRRPNLKVRLFLACFLRLCYRPDRSRSLCGRGQGRRCRHIQRTVAPSPGHIAAQKLSFSFWPL